jgi:hypothetical protein
MSLKYESELLYELMKRDGDDTPSDVLPYESELKEKYLNQVVGAYPKLQDYRPEWLNYNLYHHLPSDFPVESVTNVTRATFQNVVPYAYGKAILSGNTLVNLIDYSKIDKSFYSYSDGLITVKGTDNRAWSSVPSWGYHYKPNTMYTIIVYDKVNISHVDLDAAQSSSENKFTYTTKSDDNDYLRVKIMREDTSIQGSLRLLILEGDYANIDIPYFEGMTSCKMPVLTTTGKNLYNKEIHQLAAIMGASKELYYGTDYIPVLSNTTYTKSNNARYELYDINKTLLNGANGSTFTTTSDTRYIRYNVLKTEIDTHQLEQGSTATPYEPFKSNILTTSEEATLRGIGDVQDTLNCLTGEYVQHIDEVVFDGSEDWKTIPSWDSQNHLAFIYYFKGNVIKIINVVKCDKLSCQTWSDLNSKDIQGITLGKGADDYIVLKINKSLVSDLTSFKAWLQNNNITVQYQLATESIKTVDLTCIDEQGENVDFMPIEGTMHVSASSQTIAPLLEMSVPVEAITQNLNSFANMKEE